jgi:pyruvate/2-oxoglutarate dehydrogenase complex dihydrolipoamide dehydrogenase (E3) component
VQRFDVVVIGGGGTGSEVAFQLARRGDLRVALAERHLLGGECTHYGCVPTKVMLRSAKIASLARDGSRFGVRIDGGIEVDLPTVQRRAREVIDGSAGEGPAPFERIGVTVYLQEARLLGPRRVELADGTQLEADRVVLATGTDASIPPIPGLDSGPAWTNREAIWKPSVAPSSLAVIGAGAIGVEFAQIYARLGSEVILLEALPQVLPNEDEEAVATLVPALEGDGIRCLWGATIVRAEHRDPQGWTLEIERADAVRAEELLVAAGRRPVFDVHDLEEAGVQLDGRGRPVLGETLRTTNPDVWAAGDATGELLFTHVGSYEAEVVVDDILGRPRPRDYRVVPRVTFCDPEIASVGLTEREAREAGRDVRTSVSRITDNERSRIDGSEHGLVKLVADAATGELLGGHIVGEGAEAMIHEIVAIMAGPSPVRPVAEAIHAYPTFSESVKGALLGLLDR